MNLASTVLQMALAIVSLVNTNPGMPQWQRDQALQIANQSVQFAQNVLGNSGYTYNTYPYNYNTYPYNYNNNNYSNCTYPYYTNCNTYPYNNNYPYQSSGLGIYNSSNVDTNYLQNGQYYRITWPYNSTNVNTTVQLRNSGGGTVWIGQTTTNSLSWYASALSGTYQLEVLQNGVVVISRTVTVQ